MKKRLTLALIFTLCAIFLTACSCEHQWQEADCVAPKTCTLCAATEGEALGHDWQEADCTHPKTCTVCAATEGEPLGHDWTEADCVSPATCSRCAATEGEALGHDWIDADCTSPKTCAVCAATEGETLDHIWLAPDCVTPPTCALCGATEGEALPHSWQDADCVSPETCVRCGATEGEPLGHDWLEANCKAPKTCVLCAATEGGLGQHRYGTWIFRYNSMDRICLDCRTYETYDIDGTLLLAKNLPGTWTFAGVEKNGRFVEAGKLPAEGLDPHFSFTADGGASVIGPDADGQCTWEFTGQTVEDDIQLFYFNVLRNGEIYASLTMHGSDSQRYLSFEKDGQLSILRRDPDYMLIAGVLACREEGDYVLDLNEDHRFTGYFDAQPVSGWWQTRPSYAEDSTKTLPLLLCFDAPAEKGSILAFADYMYPDKPLKDQFTYIDYILRDGSKELSFYTYSDEYYQAVEEALALSGTWISTNLNYYNWDSGESFSNPSTEYRLTVYEDGRFEAVLMDGELSGTWELDELDIVREDGYSGIFYDVLVDGSYIGYHFQILDDSLSMYTPSDYDYDMEQMDEQELAEFEKAMELHRTGVLGDWTSTDLSTNDFSGFFPVTTEEATMDYSVSFREDGTLTAVLDREYTGTWTTLRMNKQNSGIQYSYDLSLYGEDKDAHVYCYLDIKNGLGSLRISTYSEDGNAEYSYSFRQMYGPEWENYLAEKAMIVGHWVPTELGWYNEAIGEFELLPMDNSLYLDFSEDGSYTGCFPDTVSGTWTYDGKDQDGDFCFIMYDDRSGEHYIYLYEQLTMSAWYDSMGKTILVDMEKG